MTTENTPDTPADTPATPNADLLAQTKLEKLEAQINDYKLLLADMQNSTRRLNEDAARQRKYAAEPFARDILDILDNLERASEAAKKAGETGVLVDGVTATIAAALDVLKRHAVARIEISPGGQFDPNLHMAVMQQPTNDYPPGVVVNVLQQGFTFHDRVLRPATVIVASEPPTSGNADGLTTEDA
jgi:molecular chaperone GrpE